MIHSDFQCGFKNQIYYFMQKNIRYKSDDNKKRKAKKCIKM